LNAGGKARIYRQHAGAGQPLFDDRWGGSGVPLKTKPNPRIVVEVAYRSFHHNGPSVFRPRPVDPCWRGLLAPHIWHFLIHLKHMRLSYPDVIFLGVKGIVRCIPNCTAARTNEYPFPAPVAIV